jgi:hypothetical protein
MLNTRSYQLYLSPPSKGEGIDFSIALTLIENTSRTEQTWGGVDIGTVSAEKVVKAGRTNDDTPAMPVKLTKGYSSGGI